MGRKHGRAAKKTHQSVPDYVQPVDPPRAALAVHPAGAAVALAVGAELRVFDARSQQHWVLISKPQEDEAQGLPGAQHQDKATMPYVRGVAFDAAGRYLLAGSEDKAAGLRVWDCSSWELIQTIKVPKKVTNTAFTPDSKHVLAADKFGDVLAATTERLAGQPEEQQQEPEVLLGHYCAILTSLAISSDGSFLATTDRDQRVRVSAMPADPMAGAHEIQSFCLGHTAFVTCSTFVKQGGKELLVTGGGDGTLRLWDPLNGSLLHTLQLPPLQLGGGPDSGAEQGHVLDEGSSSDEDNGVEEEAAVLYCSANGADADAEGDVEARSAYGSSNNSPPSNPVPLALVASPDGSWLVVAVDGRDELGLFCLDWDRRQLQECSWAALTDLHLPACLAFDGSGRLWAAGGPVADDSYAAFLACGSIVHVAASQAANAQQQHAYLVDAALPDWLPAQAAQELEAKTGNETTLLAEAAQRRRLASQLLKKRQYSLQSLENRKRRRRDRVEIAQQHRGVQ